MPVHPERSIFLRAIALLVLVLPIVQLNLVAADSKAKQIDAIFTAITSKQEPGLAVVVRKDGHTVFERGYGMRDLRTGIPTNSHTNYRLASITKQFTAMAIMLLVHDGKLHYDDHLTDVFPNFPAYGKQISIRNLLNHTSGLQDYPDLLYKKYAGKDWETIPQIDDEEVLSMMMAQSETLFPPGTKWEYSNSGYCVLAMVVQKVSGIRFGDFLRDRIFTPLKMRDTLAYEYGKNKISTRAYGYTKNVNVWLETDQSPTSATLGDGSVYSSVNDLIKWDDALRDHTLLSEAEMRQAITPAIVPGSPTPLTGRDGKPRSYGFGWSLEPYRGHTRMYHGGSSQGFHHAMARFPKENLTIIILCNRVDLSTWDQLNAIANLYLEDIH